MDNSCVQDLMIQTVLKTLPRSTLHIRYATLMDVNNKVTIVSLPDDCLRRSFPFLLQFRKNPLKERLRILTGTVSTIYFLRLELLFNSMHQHPFLSAENVRVLILFRATQWMNSHYWGLQNTVSSDRTLKSSKLTVHSQFYGKNLKSFQLVSCLNAPILHCNCF